MRHRLSRVTLALAVPLLAVACTGSSPVPAPTAVTTTVQVELVDYAFKPDALTAPAGKVTFVLANTGAEEHEFEILKGDAVVDEVEGLVPGLTRDLTVDLAAGEYRIVCRLNDHEVRGMVGTLTITGA